MITSYTKLLEESSREKLTVDERKFLSFATEGARRMQALINDLLAYTQAGAQDPARTPAKLIDVLEQARYSLLESIRETDAEIVAESLPEVEVDPLKMSLVFQNLISNAIKYVDKGVVPHVEISALRGGGKVHLQFRDNGIGLREEDQQRIFTPFVRLHGEEDYPGLGLGLSATLKVVEIIGGQSGVVSAPGKGSTFWIELAAGGAQ